VVQARTDPGRRYPGRGHLAGTAQRAARG